MNSDPDIEQGGSSDEAEFEASLISDVDSELATAETHIVESAEAPPKPTEQTSAKKQPAWVGKILGHFKLLRLLGEGKMGRVIQAKDVNLQRIVALKILRKRIPWLEDRERVRQFLQEARAAAQIEHPNVVRIYEINQHDGWWYIAMEMLEGENLRRLVNAVGPFLHIARVSFLPMRLRHWPSRMTWASFTEMSSRRILCSLVTGDAK
jgi:serine/threonine protein kinase